MERKIKPITPESITATKEDLIPDEVIQAFNEMIAEKWDGSESHFKRNEIVARIKTKMDIEFDCSYLDVEKIYEDLGWVVKYESASRGDSDFPPYFTFTKKDEE